LGIGGSFGEEIARCYSTRSTPTPVVGANAFIPSEAAPQTPAALFTRRFEAQLHWQPVVNVLRRTESG
jgi:hypothetical protein